MRYDVAVAAVLSINRRQLGKIQAFLLRTPGVGDFVAAKASRTPSVPQVSNIYRHSADGAPLSTEKHPFTSLDWDRLAWAQWLGLAHLEATA